MYDTFHRLLAEYDTVSCARRRDIRDRLANYLLLRGVDDHHWTQLAVCIIPTPFPRTLYSLGAQHTSLCLKLIHCMVNDPAWLVSTYASIEDIDDFVKRFCDISRRVYLDGPKATEPSYQGYVARSDYLRHHSAGSTSLKQVEINLSSVVGPYLGSKLADFQRDLLVDAGLPCDGLGECNSAEGFARALITMRDDYTKTYDQHKACILFVVEEDERNAVEIQGLVNILRSKLGRASVIITTFTYLSELFERGDLCEASAQNGRLNRLVVQTASVQLNATSREYEEVALVYFRTAYRPEQYKSETHWKVRELFERCRSIVVPSALSQLAGLKKIQQLWCKAEVLTRFLPSDIDRKFLNDLFIDQVDPSDYSSDSEARVCVNEALKEPKDWVLKPQREGGGNNVYGRDIVEVLEREKENSSSAYVLMRRIESPTNPTVFLRKGQFEYEDKSVCEIGFFQASLYFGNVCRFSQSFDHILRTKVSRPLYEKDRQDSLSRLMKGAFRLVPQR